jgi:Tol biopolymer transport system component
LHVSAENGSEEIWTTRVNGDDPIRVVRERALSSPRWSPSGEWIYYVVPTGVVQALWKVQGDPGTAGEAEPLPVLSGITGLGPLAFTSDGQTLTYARHVVDRDLWLFSTSDGWEGSQPVSKRLTSGTALDDWPSVSPNGRDIAFVRVMGEVSNIFIRPIDGGTARQVTFMEAECFNPVWSPDGQEIAFVAYDSGAYRVWTVSAKGGAAHVFEKTRVSEDCELAWAPGKNILYQKPGNRSFMILDPASGAESSLIANEDLGWVSTPVISPDGGSAAVAWLTKSDDQPGIWIISMVDSSQTLVTRGHKHPCGWSRDGQWIYYYDVPTIGRIRSDGSDEEVILSLPFDDIDTHPHVSMGPDGKNLVGGFKVQTPSDIWLIENFDPDI